jgi:hypothetical protein
LISWELFDLPTAALELHLHQPLVTDDLRLDVPAATNAHD